MKISNKLILSFLLLIVPTLVIGIVSAYNLNIINRQINTGIKESVGSIEKNIVLNSNAQFIRYYDEILTQSARNYAFTGDIIWKERYLQTVPLLDNKIKDAVSLGDIEDKKIFASVDDSNLVLIDLETKALNLVDKGLNKEAVDILNGVEYQNQKEKYKQGLLLYIEKQGKKYDETLSVSTNNLTENILSVQHALQAGIYWTIVGILITILVAVFMGFTVARLITKPIEILNKITKEVASGNLEQEIYFNSKDEIGDLAKSFNVMVKKVKEAKENIEGKVKDRTLELEKTNKFMVGRELKMIELKKEILKLKQTKNE